MTVAIASSLDVAVVVATTSAALEASAGTAAIVNVLVAPTLAAHVFWLATIPVAVGVTLLGK